MSLLLTAMAANFYQYVYFSLTGSSLSPEALEKLKENEYYTQGELLVEAYR